MTDTIRIDALIFVDCKEGSRFFSKYYAEKLAKMPAPETMKLEKRLFENFGQIIEEMKDGGDRRRGLTQPRFSPSKAAWPWCKNTRTSTCSSWRMKTKTS